MFAFPRALHLCRFAAKTQLRQCTWTAHSGKWVACTKSLRGGDRCVIRPRLGDHLLIALMRAIWPFIHSLPSLCLSEQTTAPISWSATAEEMKAALETLSLISTVDVSRQVAGNGYMWTITFTTIRTNALLNGGALTPLVRSVTVLSRVLPSCSLFTHLFLPTSLPQYANPLTLASSNPALTAATISVYGTREVTVTGLQSGISYYARVVAGNAIGYGPAALSSPPFLAPTNQVCMSIV